MVKDLFQKDGIVNATPTLNDFVVEYAPTLPQAVSFSK